MSAVLYQKENGVAKITLNRPDAFNSVDESLSNEWLAALEDCAVDPAVRVVVITGSGKARQADAALWDKAKKHKKK